MIDKEKKSDRWDKIECFEEKKGDRYGGEEVSITLYLIDYMTIKQNKVIA